MNTNSSSYETRLLQYVKEEFILSVLIPNLGIYFHVFIFYDFLCHY